MFLNFCREARRSRKTDFTLLRTLVDRDDQLYAQDQKHRGRSSRSADLSDVSEPYLKNTGCKDQSPDRGPPCIF